MLPKRRGSGCCLQSTKKENGGHEQPATHAIVRSGRLVRALGVLVVNSPMLDVLGALGSVKPSCNI